MVLISAFQVPVDADEPFVSGWERARDFLAAKQALTTAVLHRALRADADFRFVDVAQVDDPVVWREAVADPAFPGAGLPFKSHAALYEVIHEDGKPEGHGGVVLVNPFEVPADDDIFVDGWTRAREALASQRGYLGTRLHRSVGAADFRFVNVARWSSPLAFAKAVEQPEFRRIAAAMPFASHPALYQPVGG